MASSGNSPLQAIALKEVSRKEFLMLAVLAVGSVFGLGTIIRLLTGKSLKSLSADKLQLNGYGARKPSGK